MCISERSFSAAFLQQFRGFLADLFGSPCRDVAKMHLFWQGSGNNSATSPEENGKRFLRFLMEKDSGRRGFVDLSWWNCTSSRRMYPLPQMGQTKINFAAAEVTYMRHVIMRPRKAIPLLSRLSFRPQDGLHFQNPSVSGLR